ncbi:MAG: antibiotic biosynthesis monooxygenase [Caulobacter sp.]
MTIEYIRYRLAEHTAAELTNAYAGAEAFLKAAPQCLAFDLSHCEEDPALMTLRIVWTSTQEHLTGFRKGEHFPGFLACIRPFIAEIVEMNHYAPTAVAWATGADA